MGKNRYINMTLFIIIPLLIAAWYIYPVQVSAGYVPVLPVRGDVEESFELEDPAELDRIEIDYKGHQLEVLQLKDIIKMAGPVGEDYDIIFSARDGLRARISGGGIEECFIHFSERKGWEAVNLNHPVSSNVKYLEEIIIVSRNPAGENSLNIISPEENLYSTTPGNLLAGACRYYPYFEGTSTVTENNREYEVSIYTGRRTVDPGGLMNKEIGPLALVVGENGEMLRYRGGMLEIKNNRIDYIDPEEKEEIRDCQGIIINPPVRRNMDVFHDSLYYLEKGERVLVIFLDGFGFYQYEYAVENNFVPSMAGLGEAERALSVYQPVTNAGLAAALTGTGPERNGVSSRKNKNLLVPDIFQKAKESGVRSLYIEGNINILNTFIEPVLNPDLNKNGTTDDEVFAETLDGLKDDYGLIFAHFHGIDDSGHDNGPLDKATMEVIKRTDDYIQKLAANWPGKVIITADHGMHDIVGGGDHGRLLYQDMFVPYLITDGGDNDE